VYMLFRAFPELLDTPTIKINGYIPEIIILLKNNYPELEKQLKLAYQSLLSDVGFQLVSCSLPTEILLSNLTELIDILDQQVLEIKTEPELKVTFLQRLIGYLILEIKQGKSYRNELEQWLQKYLKNDWKSLVRLLEFKREQKRTNSTGGTEQEKEPCLLVSVTKENNGLRLRSWIIEDVKHYDPTQESPQKRNYCKSLQSNEGIIIKNLEQQFFVQYLRDVYQEALN
ncbi:MAG: serine protease, partial [Microcystis panniformis]